MRNSFSFGLIVVLFLHLLLFTSCQDECDKCNAAIQHFVSKLPDNGCNPSFMQNALDRITEDCDGHINTTVTAAIAADACCNSTIPALACENSGRTPWKTDFKFTNTVDFFLSPVTISFGPESNPLEHSIEMNGMSELIIQDIEVVDYSEMVFSVYRDGMERFKANPVTLKAQRNVDPCLIRKVDFREIGAGIFDTVNFNWQ